MRSEKEKAMMLVVERREESFWGGWEKKRRSLHRRKDGLWEEKNKFHRPSVLGKKKKIRVRNLSGTNLL